MQTAEVLTGEEVVPQKQHAVVVDIKTGFQPLPELVSDHEGNQYCPQTGQILFCNRVPTNRNLLYDTF
jgi:hypothetical protein